jgi:ribosome-associated protein
VSIAGRAVDGPVRSAPVAGRWLQVTPSCRVAVDDLDWRVSRSGGPGGQHANTSDTRVEVSLDIRRARSLRPEERARLHARFGPVVRAVSADSRSQARNRELALGRLRARLAEGLRVPRARRATRPSAAARAARLDAKRRRGEVKRDRARPGED